MSGAKILAYHRVWEHPNPNLADWAVRPSAFERQMRLLAKLGYQGISLAELLDRFAAGRPADKAIAITFDDGYRDTVEVAAPILARLGFTATVYVVPDYVGDVTGWDRAAGGEMPELATWDELLTLQARGWEIGLHTASHPADLGALTGPDLDREILAARDEVERHSGLPVRTLAYPHGNYSAATIACLESSGLEAAVTVQPGLAAPDSPRFELPRYEIKRRDTLPEFLTTIALGLTPRRRSTVDAAMKALHISRA